MATSCIDEEVALQLVNEQVDERRAAAILAHLDECAGCCDLVALAAMTERTDDGAELDESAASLRRISTLDDVRACPLPLVERSMVTAMGVAVAGRTAQWLLSEGDDVATYRVIKRLGRGGMSEVYLARDRDLRRMVALKLLHAADDANEDARTLAEAMALARFSHPNIATVFQLGKHEGRRFIALEYVPGNTLRQHLLQWQPLALGHALRIARELASALEEAHRNGILHRDLKPSNVVLGEDDGRVRVLDFGLAQIVGGQRAAAATAPGSGPRLQAVSTSERTAVGRDFPQLAATGFTGTPAYGAPEQWNGVIDEPAIDVWALGLIMIELFGGEQPLRNRDVSTIASLMTSDAPLPVSLPDAVPASLRPLIERCFARNPRLRPEARQLREELERLHMQQLTIAQREADKAAQPRPPTKLRRWGIGAIAVVLLAGSLASWAVLRSRGRARTPAATVDGAAAAKAIAAMDPAATSTKAAPDARPAAASSTHEPTPPTKRPSKAPATDAARRPPPSKLARSRVRRTPSRRTPSRRTPSRRTPSRRTPSRRTRAPSAKAIAAAATTATGSIWVDTFRDGGGEQWARVYLDDRYVGDSPKLLRGISVGTHRLRFEHASYRTQRRSVQVSATRRAVVKVLLQPKK